MWSFRAAVLISMVTLSACSASPVEPTPPEVDRTPTAAAETTPSATATPAREWEEPDAYSFTLKSSCGWMALPGPVRVTVEGGKVVATMPLASLADLRGRAVPTIGDILARVEEARRSGADVVEVTTDPQDGHPVSIEIDRRQDHRDDEECYEVSEYVTSV